MLFKTPILPCWEDSSNSTGGRWVLYFSKTEQTSLNLDVCWLAAVCFTFSNERQNASCFCLYSIFSFKMLALIGGQYAQDSKYVNGVVLSSRKTCDRIALWTSNHQDQEMVFRVG